MNTMNTAKSAIWAVIDTQLPKSSNLIDVKTSREDAREVKRNYNGNAQIVRYRADGVIR